MQGNWRELFGTKYDKELEKISLIFTPNQKLSSIGNALEYVFDFKGDFILVGGLARRFHSTPRNTGDIDILFRNEEEMSQFLSKNKGYYKPLRKHAILVNGTEVDLLTPEFLQIPDNIIEYIFTHREFISGSSISVVNKEGLILLKLFRMSATDDNDIRALIEAGGKFLDIDTLLSLAEDKKHIIEDMLKQSKPFLEE